MRVQKGFPDDEMGSKNKWKETDSQASQSEPVSKKPNSGNSQGPVSDEGTSIIPTYEIEGTPRARIQRRSAGARSTRSATASARSGESNPKGSVGSAPNLLGVGEDAMSQAQTQHECVDSRDDNRNMLSQENNDVVDTGGSDEAEPTLDQILEAVGPKTSQQLT